MEDIEKIYDRTKVLFTDMEFKKIQKAHILICGIGGVGSFAFEALVRLGIGTITIIDKDIIDVTNINRQIIADTTNIGEDKTNAAILRAKNINPNILINGYNENISSENFLNILNKINKKIDYIIDAIDLVDGKIAMIEQAKDLNIPIISSMGMANRLNPLDIKINDISKTSMCPLAKIIRKKLKEKNINNVKVVYSTEETIKNTNKILGSVSFVPSVAGLVIASEVVKDITKRC